MSWRRVWLGWCGWYQSSCSTSTRPLSSVLMSSTGLTTPSTWCASSSLSTVNSCLSLAWMAGRVVLFLSNALIKKICCVSFCCCCCCWPNDGGEQCSVFLMALQRTITPPAAEGVMLSCESTSITSYGPTEKRIFILLLLNCSVCEDVVASWAAVVLLAKLEGSIDNDEFHQRKNSLNRKATLSMLVQASSNCSANFCDCWF